MLFKFVQNHYLFMGPWADSERCKSATIQDSFKASSTHSFRQELVTTSYKKSQTKAFVPQHNMDKLYWVYQIASVIQWEAFVCTACRTQFVTWGWSKIVQPNHSCSSQFDTPVLMIKTYKSPKSPMYKLTCNWSTVRPQIGAAARWSHCRAMQPHIRTRQNTPSSRDRLCSGRLALRCMTVRGRFWLPPRLIRTSLI